MRFLIALLPWLELSTLILLGIEFGLLAALGWVFLTLALGVILLQRQGREIVQSLRRGELQGPELLVDELALGAVGLLLIIPGLLTDTLAVLILIGPLRRRIAQIWRGPAPQTATSREAPGQSYTIEGEYRRVDAPGDP